MKLFSAVLFLCLLVPTPVPLAAQDTDKDVQELGANLPGVNLHDLTLMVQKLTGRKFLWTEELGLRNKRVNFVAPDPIKGADNIFRVYQHFLQVNGLILVPAREPEEGEEHIYVGQSVVSRRRGTAASADVVDAGINGRIRRWR